MLAFLFSIHDSAGLQLYLELVSTVWHVTQLVLPEFSVLLHLALRLNQRIVNSIREFESASRKLRAPRILWFQYYLLWIFQIDEQN